MPSDLYSFLGDAPGEVVLKVNGQPVSLQIDKGYARLERELASRATRSSWICRCPSGESSRTSSITSNQGKVALQRGPVVYCLEGPDNDGKVLDLVIRDDAELKTQFQPDLLGGVVTISGQAETAKRTLDGRIVPDAKRPFTAIPYYAWAHRGQAQMTVWPARVPEGARPKPADTLTYLSKTTASFVHVSLDAIKDQNVPADSADSSNLQLDFWPHSGTTEWVQFEWNEPHELSSVKVYWFDDTGRGACHLPQDLAHSVPRCRRPIPAGQEPRGLRNREGQVQPGRIRAGNHHGDQAGNRPAKGMVRRHSGGRDRMIRFSRHGFQSAAAPAAIVLLAIIAQLSLEQELWAQPNSRPNIVLILVDDLGWTDLGCYGHAWHETPNIDRLAAQGMRFLQAYAPAPICSASRASILTGKTTARVGLEFVVKDKPGSQAIVPAPPLQTPPYTLALPLEQTTIAELLADAGYETAYFGKWHLNPHHEGRYLAWSPTHGPAQQGFSQAIEDFGSHPYNKTPLAKTDEPGHFYPDSMTGYAIAFLKQPHPRPFFLMVAHFYVHTPVRTPYLWLTDRYEKRIPADAGNRERRIAYAAFVTTLDHYVGQLLDALQQQQLSDNTLVVFLSDNGGHPQYVANGPLRGSKWNLYEGGIRVPMLARWPSKITPGRVLRSR